jgi:hypothetical protein
MRLPVIQGVIRRRVLVNFRVDPEVMARTLPPGFSPRLVAGQALAGICLIRLEEIRPLATPARLGLSSENAAHRVAVEWTTESGGPRSGVYIPRRDTNSSLVMLAGGRLFPGEHHKARFKVEDDGSAIRLQVASEDGEVEVNVRGHSSAELPHSSHFSSLQEASNFFEVGAIGYSSTRKGDRLEGLELQTNAWHVEPLDLAEVHSSYFSDESVFPQGTVDFDCALVMRDIPHRWRTAPELPSAPAGRGV